MNSFSNSYSSTSFSQTQSPSMSAPGKFVLRLRKLEEENENLRKELANLQRWKLQVSTWLFDAFGFPSVPEFTIREDSEDNDVSVTSNNSQDGKARPTIGQEPDYDVVSLGVVKLEKDNKNNSKAKGDPSGSYSLNTTVLIPNLQNNGEMIENEQGKETETVVSESGLSSTANVLASSEHQQNDLLKTLDSISNLIGSTFPQEEASSSSYKSPTNKQISFPSKEIASSIATCSSSCATENQLALSGSTPATSDASEPDPPCDVCLDPIPEDLNEMIFCDKCNICVHQVCYGVPVIPQGQWFCQPCARNIPLEERVCRFCTIKGGAMVPVLSPNRNSWAHVSCALWIPEIRFNNPEIKDKVVGLPNVEKSRWKLTCYICTDGKDKTCCIQCDYKRCPTSFHVTCGQKAGLRMDMLDVEKSKAAPEGVIFIRRCQVHREMEPSTPSKSPQKKKRKIE